MSKNHAKKSCKFLAILCHFFVPKTIKKYVEIKLGKQSDKKMEKGQDFLHDFFLALRDFLRKNCGKILGKKCEKK